MDNIKALGTLSGTLSSKGSLTGSLSVPQNTGSGEVYSGNYEVTPRAYDKQVLNTANKLLVNDVTVRSIPYWETSNQSNGTTVYIAEEI